MPADARRKRGHSRKDAEDGFRVVKMGVSLPEDLAEWIDEQVKADRYASRSHLIRTAVRRMREARKE